MRVEVDLIGALGQRLGGGGAVLRVSRRAPLPASVGRSAVVLPLVASTGAGHEQGQAQKGAALLGIGNAQEVLRERRPDG